MPREPLLAPRRRHRELLRISRPVGWFLAAGLFRVGLAYGGARESALTVLLTLELTFPFCLLLFGLNDLADRESDALNPRKGNLFHGARPAVEMRTPIAIGVAVAAATLVPWFVVLPRASAALLLLVVTLSVLYSTRLGPVPRLKEVPVLDGLASAGIILGLMGVGYTLGSSLSDLGPEPFAFVPSVVAFHVFASLPDEEADRAAGHRTVPVRFGARVTAFSCVALSFVSVALIPAVSFAPAVAAGAVVVFAGAVLHVTAPRWFTSKRVMVACASIGGVCLAHLLFFEV